ncbi:hypothetical protein EDM52_02040 [Brevibacillus invocatus]|uniref:Uncharacterized protein n=1 Tax=Brevibacillus invocatus TaxID=173959 RepID=A0A3M8CLU6_9BACL|nr:hypothetical protein EDM52_02040 [Brevibacillus invocatus]
MAVHRGLSHCFYRKECGTWLFLEKKVTLARAAELAGKSLSDFIDYLSDCGIAWMEYTEEDRRLDDQTISRLLAEEGEKDA